MDSSQAGPSTAKLPKPSKKAKSTVQSAPSPVPQLSNETVESSDESEASSVVSADSEDLEAVTPKKRVNPAAGTARAAGKLPKYAVPPGMSEMRVSMDLESSAFEYDNMASNPDLQLWAIRLPSDFKPSRLSSLSLTTNPSPHGTLKTKSQTYTLHPTGTGQTLTHTTINSEGRQPTAGIGAVGSMLLDVNAGEEEQILGGGEEMGTGLRLMVPRAKDNGKLFISPIPITQHLILQPDLPKSIIPPTTGDETTQPLPSFLSTSIPKSTISPADAMEGLLKPVGKRREQPKGVLKFRNAVNGFDTPGPGIEGGEGLEGGDGERGGMEVDAIPGGEGGKGKGSREAGLGEDSQAKSQSQSQIQSQGTEKKEKKTKRKSEVTGEAPKKKKPKAV